MRYLFTLFFSLTVLVSTAQKQPLRQPLTFVSADSVGFLDRDITNLHLLPLYIDTAIAPRPLLAPKKEFKKALTQWKERGEGVVNLAGGRGDEVREPQAFSAADVLYAAAPMLLYTGHAHYADLMERAIFNALPATIFTTQPYLEKHVAAQALMNAAGMVYATSDEGIYVNLFLNGFVRVHTSTLNFGLDQITGMPFLPTVRFRFNHLPHAQTFTLFIRLPEWAEERPVLRVNGHAVDYEVINGYMTLRRTWQQADEVFFELSLTPRFVATPRGRILRSGPLLYAFPPLPTSHGAPTLLRMTENSLSRHPDYEVAFPTEADTLVVTARPYLEAQGAATIFLP